MRHDQTPPVCPAVLLGVPLEMEQVVRRYVSHVRLVVAGQSVLTGRQRSGLLAVAQRQGIGRFHANLVIAAMLHEGRPATPSVAVRRHRNATPSLWLTLLATQITILGVAALLWSYL
jgi:hypothetical protein